MKRMLDLFCGRGGWTNAFLERGWEVHGVDLVRHSDYQGSFIENDVMDWGVMDVSRYDFICASSPCEEFSVHGMKHFHPNPKYPENGIRLFNHTRAICEASGKPYIMENVRAAQQFVGRAMHHCGPFYLWGTGVPPLMPQGIKKGLYVGGGVSSATIKRLSKEDPEAFKKLRRESRIAAGLWSSSKSQKRKQETAQLATIPTELSMCVVEYADRLTEHATLSPCPLPLPATPTDQ